MKRNTKTILTGATILVIFVGGYLVYKLIDKQNKLKKILMANEEREKEEASLPPEQQSSADNYSPTDHVKQIGDMVYGNNFWQYTEEVNAIIIPLSDERTRKLALAYKQKYGISLYANLVGEIGLGLYEDSEAKLKRLGLV